MHEKRSVELSGAQETLLFTLYGRAVETGRPRRLLSDPKAVEMIDAIDYEFSRFDGTYSLRGCVVRTAILDHWVQAFLDRHPAGTVIEIGTGLNTRFERLDNGQVSWVDLDLPDVIALRRHFFTDTARRRMIAASVVDEAWPDVAREFPGPYFLVAEGSLVYLSPADAHRALRLIAERFPGSRLAFDTNGRWIVEQQAKHDVLKNFVRLSWACDDPRQLEQVAPGLRLRESRTFARIPRAVASRIPFAFRLRAQGGAPFRAPGRAYRLNLFDVGPAPERPRG
ncbi:MAG: class I SAM-dependent methyltransferase [Pseudonocardia sp.]